MGFNKFQEKAIKIKKGPAIILAGPGSGKTTVITEHTKFLLEQGLTQDSNILVVTFTKNSAKEMHDRFNELTNNTYPNVTFGTFHSIYFQIAKEKYSYNETNLLDTQDRNVLLRNIVKRLSIEVKDERDFFAKLSNEISSVKCECVDIETYSSPYFNDLEFRVIYKEYQKELETNIYIDYDDMLLLCHKTLIENPDILKKYQDKYKHILVDEFQDTNTIQFEVVKMLALPENNLFVVGDDDQSIYKFRGAKPEIMLDFPNLYPKCKNINLKINYRSTPAIVEGAQIVISNNKNRFPKELEANKKTGEDIYLKTLTNPFIQANEVADKVNENIALGVDPNQIAIIYRTNQQTSGLVETLLTKGIPFYVRDGISNVYEHWVAKEIFAYVQLAIGKPENVHLSKIINKPKRYVENKCLKEIKDITLDNIILYYQTNSEKDWLLDGLIKLKGHLSTLKTITRPHEILEYILNDIGYNDYLKEYCEKTKTHLDDLTLVVDELLNTSQNYETCEEWFQYIVQYTKDINESKGNNQKTKDAINLLTMHASKGLEYEVVFIVDANEGITPSYKVKSNEDIEEERRMFYVAMTRAKSRLYIYTLRERNGKTLEPSRFVKELSYGLKKKKEETEKDRVIKAIEKTQKTIDKINQEKEKEKPEITIETILNENKPIPLDPKPMIEGVDTTKEVYHNAFENGYIQKEENDKLSIYFVKKAKIIILKKSFCEEHNLLKFF